MIPTLQTSAPSGGMVLDEDHDKRPEPEKVTKLAGAERLLKTAISLYFEDGDMLAVHSLAAGAHAVLRTLLVKRGLRGSNIKDSDVIRSEYFEEYIGLMNSTQNFLKHADRDPDGIHDFYPESTGFWIFDCVDMYHRLTGRTKYKVFHIFKIWFLAKHPHYLKEGAYKDQVKALCAKIDLSKHHFSEIIKDPSLFPMNDLI